MSQITGATSRRARQAQEHFNHEGREEEQEKEKGKRQKARGTSEKKSGSVRCQAWPDLRGLHGQTSLTVPPDGAGDRCER